MSTEHRADRAFSRRALLGAAGTAAFAAGSPAITRGASVAARLADQLEPGPGRFVRPLGSPDLPCTGPGLCWIDLDEGPVSVSLETTGRPVRITAKIPVEYGGPDGSFFGVSFAEDGVDILRDDQRGLATLHIDGSTVAAGILEPTTVRHVPAGVHVWTLRFRREQPMSDDAAQRSYVRTRRVAPLEFTVEET